MGSTIYKLVQDFFHPQYDIYIERESSVYKICLYNTPSQAQVAGYLERSPPHVHRREPSALKGSKELVLLREMDGK